MTHKTLTLEKFLKKSVAVFFFFVVLFYNGLKKRIISYQNQQQPTDFRLFRAELPDATKRGIGQQRTAKKRKEPTMQRALMRLSLAALLLLLTCEKTTTQPPPPVATKRVATARCGTAAMLPAFRFPAGCISTA